MSAALDTRAEIVKLARLLGREPDELSYLAAVPSDALRELRERATDSLFDADDEPLRRVAKAAGIPPVQVLPPIAERVFGPLLCARVAGYVDPGRAVEIAKRLPASFLADVAVEVDPRRASVVIGEISADTAVEVGRELVARREFVAMGRFFGHVSGDALRGAIETFDAEALLRTAFVLEGKERLDDVVPMLPPERLKDLLRTAGEAGLWPETLDLVTQLDPAHAGALADLAADEPDEVLDSMVRAAHDEGLWDSVLPFVREMSDESQRRFARLPSLEDGEVLDAIVDAAAAGELWGDLLPLVDLLPQASHRRIAMAASHLDRKVIERIVASAGEDRSWTALIGLAATMDDSTRDVVFDLVAGLDDDLLRSLAVQLPAVIDGAETPELRAAATAVLGDLPPALEARLAAVVSELNRGARTELAARARELGLIEELGAIGDALAR